MKEELRPDDRCHDRREAADQGDACGHPHQPLPAEQIPDHRRGHHRTSGGAEALAEPRERDDLDARSDCDHEARRDVKPRRRSHGNLPADRVAQRADDELAQAQADGGRGERELNHRRAGVQVGLDQRKRREVEVHRERAQRGEAAQDHDEHDRVQWSACDDGEDRRGRCVLAGRDSDFGHSDLHDDEASPRGSRLAPNA